MDLTFSLAPLTVGRQKLDTHRLMHLYAQRIAAVRRRFVEVFALDESSFPAETEATSPRLRVFLFEDRRDYEGITPAVTGLGAHGSSMKLMGPKLAYCAYCDPAQLPDDAAVHRSVAHGIAHLLLSSANPPLWIGNRGHGWLDEGIAHWFEAEVDGLCTTFCFEEVGVAPGTGFNRGRWKNGIRKLLEAGELRPFSELFGKTGDEFDLVDHAHAFAFVDWLLDAHGGPPLMELVARVKRGAETRDAMAAVYGFGPLEFDAPFRAWVKERYPLRVEVR